VDAVRRFILVLWEGRAAEEEALLIPLVVKGNQTMCQTQRRQYLRVGQECLPAIGVERNEISCTGNRVRDDSGLKWQARALTTEIARRQKAQLFGDTVDW